MLNDIEQNQESGDNCTNQQAGRDINIYQGVTEEQCRKMCLALFKDNFVVLRDEARRIANERCSDLTDIFIDKLSKQEDEIKKQIEQSLREPAMQEAIFKAQHAYVSSGNEEKLSLLLKMLEDRVFAEDLDKILIDDCMDIVSEITSKQIELIKFQYLQESYYKDFDSFLELEAFYKNRYRDISEDFLLLEPFDLEYLVYKKLLEKSGSKIIYWNDRKEFSMQDEKCRRNLEKSYPHLKPYMDKEIVLKFDSYNLTPLSKKLASFIVEDKAI